MSRSFTATLKILRTVKIFPSNILLLIKKFAPPTLKAHISVLKSDMNTNDVPKWLWDIYLKSQLITCDLIKDLFW